MAEQKGDALDKKVFPVKGMTCASCVISVESILKSQFGVKKASVSLADNTANVEYEKDITSPEKLKKAVQSIGYDLYIEDNATEEADAMRLKDFEALKKKVWASGVLSLPVFVIAMFLQGQIPYANWILMFFTAPVLFIFGGGFFINAFKQAKHFSANMDTLVALSTGVAYVFSAFITVFPGFATSHSLPSGTYFESAAVITFFILLGRLLEERAKAGTSSAIKKLMSLQPKTVKVIRNGQETEELIESVLVGQQIIIRPGESIPVDGKVLSGNTFIDESAMTGEPLPAEKKEGAKVFAGTMNQQGSITIEAEKVGRETMLAHIIQTVKEAQGSKAPAQKLADKIAGVFVPVVIVISIISFIAWYFVGGDLKLSHALLSAITVLIISCPCALGLATPVAVMVSTGQAAKNGILVRDAETLENARNINAIVFDKTGTITKGKPVVADIKWLAPEEGFAAILSGMESRSEHPLAAAIAACFKTKNIKPVVPENFKNIVGRGIIADFNGAKYFAGNADLLMDNNVMVSNEARAIAKQWGDEAKTVIYFAGANKILAVIALADEIKVSSASAISELKSKGIEVFMVTGDNLQTASSIAKQAGIAQFYAGALPADKAAFVKNLKQKGRVVAMVGDGINDSEALAVADVGIAMGKGADIAMDTAGITLVNSDISVILKLIQLSRRSILIIRQNLFWAFIYNIIGIPVAAGVLYPFFHVMLNPMIAAGAMALSSVTVVSNSLRIRGV